MCSQDNTGSIDLSVSGGTLPYTYAWTGPGGPYTTQDLSGLSAGTYNVTVTDANGCVTTNSFTLTEPNLLACTVVGVDGSISGVPTGSIDLSVSGGILPYTYAWTGPGGPYTTQDLSGLSAGTYNVTVTDANGSISICTIR